MKDNKRRKENGSNEREHLKTKENEKDTPKESKEASLNVPSEYEVRMTMLVIYGLAAIAAMAWAPIWVAWGITAIGVARSLPWAIRSAINK